MSAFSEEARHCRLCGKTAWTADLVKYAVRSYAHFQCFYEQKSSEDIARLPLHPREQLERWIAFNKVPS